MSNHLGNVLTTITDKVNMTGDSVWTNVASASDYYPFGLEMKGRVFNDTTYRYGFNGKEKGKSFASASVYDYGFRIYNQSIAKFSSIDPLTREYPWNSTYAFAENRPIEGIDLEGLEFFKKTDTKENFTASAVVYEKVGDSYNAVAKFDYSFDSSFDKNGKGSVSNVKQQFTDLSDKK